MHVSHFLLGRSQQYDTNVMHDEFHNRFLFVKDEKSIVLVSLSLKQVYKDGLKLKENKKAENESLYLKERVIQNIFFVNKVLMIKRYIGLVMMVCF